jgi:alkylhydroperoxidase family enzyme
MVPEVWATVRESTASRDSELFDPLERLVMEYAEAMTETPPTVDDELVKRLLKHLDEAQLVETLAFSGCRKRERGVSRRFWRSAARRY